VANLYPIADFPTGAFLSMLRSTMIAGLPVVHGLTGSATSELKVRNSLAEAIDKVQALRPTILWGVPSFIRRFLAEAGQRAAAFPAVRLIVTSGEPVPPGLRAELQEMLAGLGAGAVDIRARYAFTEMQGGLVQCAAHAEPQNLGPDLYYLETVDPETQRRLPDGESGMLALTHLHRRRRSPAARWWKRASASATRPLSKQEIGLESMFGRIFFSENRHPLFRKML
jgi:phenylacetate-CoA ligase